ncbi:MAG: PQQ-binding-like beta-propeller repeat protein [Deltaproteobacteria bacterium]|nr:PQQ-binding-like beta-propeller repeat protein [Deltaproteobacteria bacterium]
MNVLLLIAGGLFIISNSTWDVNQTHILNFNDNTPTFRGSLKREGRSPFKGPVKFNVKWTFQTTKGIFSSPVTDSSGNIYFGGQDGYFYCVNKKGGLNWKFYVGDDVDSTPSLGDDGTVYFGSDNGYLYALNRKGNLKWKLGIGSPVRCSPLILEKNTIIVTNYNGYVYAIRRGTTLWQSYLTGGWSNSSPTWNEKKSLIMVANNRGTLAAFTKSGVKKWQKQLTGYHYNGAVQNSTLPVDDNGNVYISANTGVYCFSSSGKQLWKNSSIKAAMPVTILKNGDLVIVDTRGYLHKISSSGKSIWKRKVAGYGNYSNIAVDKSGNMYFGSRDDYFYGVDADGNRLFSQYTGKDVDSTPTITPDGCIVFGTDSGKLYKVCDKIN